MAIFRFGAIVGVMETQLLMDGNISSAVTSPSHQCRYLVDGSLDSFVCKHTPEVEHGTERKSIRRLVVGHFLSGLLLCSLLAAIPLCFLIPVMVLQ